MADINRLHAISKRHLIDFNLMSSHRFMHHNPDALQTAKQLVGRYCAEFDQTPVDQLTETLSRYTAPEYHWRGLHPFDHQHSAQHAIDAFWQPLKSAFSALQRRVDVFFAGHNVVPHERQGTTTLEAEHETSVWTCQMGHLAGLMDKPWLDIPPTRRLVMIRFAEFHRVHDGVIKESALFIDLIGVMRQAGQYPLPPSTGASLVYPGPATNDGVLLQATEPAPGHATLELMRRMVQDLTEANHLAEQTDSNRVPREVLVRSWHENMLWYGPEGIGASYTIDRYQQQHQFPFRLNLAGKQFNGHIARFAEGNYGCFFGWPNLTNTATGGFLGLSGSHLPADMRVMDVYRRDGDKLIENWVIIDLPHWLNMQGLDVLARMRQLLGVDTL